MLLDLFEGKLELGLAAYNAGENRVEEWLSEADRNDVNFDEPTEFIESIPFTETRGYVQSVLRNAELYRRDLPGAGFQSNAGKQQGG